MRDPGRHESVRGIRTADGGGYCQPNSTKSTNITKKGTGYTYSAETETETGTGQVTRQAQADKINRQTHDNPLIPGENCKLVEASNQIPSSSDVASYKDRKGEDGKGVHRTAVVAVSAAAVFSAVGGLMGCCCCPRCPRCPSCPSCPSCPGRPGSRRRIPHTAPAALSAPGLVVYGLCFPLVSPPPSPR